jgi:Ariadne domain
MPSFDLEYVCDTLAEETRNQETRVDEQWSEDALLVLQKKREMAHLAHYHARYAAHDQGQQYAARRSDDIAVQIHAFHRLADNFSGTYADFLVIANERLVILRRVLKYSYILAYYLPEDSDSNRMQKDLFQHRQEMLERFTEQLSHISENATSQLDRAQVVNLLGIVEKCLMNLLEFMHGIP